MSDPNQEFLQSQQHNQLASRGGAVGGVSPQHQPSQMGATGGGGGFPNSIPYPQTGPGPHNGRTGMGIGVNRNGNNHIDPSMVTGYSPHPPEDHRNSRGGYSQSESNRPASRDQPMTSSSSGSQHQANFSMGYRDSPAHATPTGHLSYQPAPSGKPNLSSQSKSCEYRNGRLSDTEVDPRFNYGGHDDISHHHYSSRTPRGGYRNFVERSHPYTRPPQSDPPRHMGGWR